MALDRINPTTTNSWKKLESLNSKIDIKRLFENDDSRSEKYSISFGNMFVDFSKNLVDDEILETLLKLSNECNLKEAIEKQLKWAPSIATADHGGFVNLGIILVCNRFLCR